MRPLGLVVALSALAFAPGPALADGVASAGSSGRARAAHARAETPIETLAAANARARQHPSRAGFAEARHIYAYEPGALYELYASPNFVSTVLLEPGETVTDIAAGDTARWLVTQASAESEADARTIVLVKPEAANLRTNIVLITNRRTYLIEAVSRPGDIYSAQIAWSYPTASQAPATVSVVNDNYRIRTIRGLRPLWSPARVYDDGHRTFIAFDLNVAAGDLPPLFVVTGEGEELVNYRVEGSTYVVDRLFDAAELRLGTRAPVIVRIERRAPRRGVRQ